MFKNQKGHACPQAGFSPLILLPLIFIALVGVFLGVLLLKNKLPTSNTTSTYSSPTPIASIQSPLPEVIESQPLEEGTNLIVYKIENGSLKKVTSFKDLTYNPNTSMINPVLSQAGDLFVASKDRIYKYSLVSERKDEIYTIQDQKYNVLSVSYLDNRLYVSAIPADYYGADNQDFIEELNLTNNSIRTIGPLKRTLYGGQSYLFKTSRGQDVVGTFGGDGCGGYGEISLMEGSNAKQILKTGGGCVEDPRYMGNVGDSLILLSVVPNSFSETNFREKVDLLYLQNVYSGQKETILDLKNISDKIKAYLYDRQSQKLVLEVDKQLWVVDLNTNNIEKRPFDNAINENDHLSGVFADNKIYYIKQDAISNNLNMSLKIYNLQTKKTEGISWPKISNITGNFQFLGIYKNTPYIALQINPQI